MHEFHQLTLDAPEHEALVIAAALENFEAPAPHSVTARRMGRASPWRVEAIFGALPDGKAIGAFLRSVAENIIFTVSPLKDEDWVALGLRQLPPIRTQRFYVRGTHVPLPVDLGTRRAITIEAGLAFGTGHHATTHGCLLALENLKVRSGQPRRVLDLGAGTGLLAVAAHELWPAARIVASDNDGVAVAVAGENARANGAPGVRQVLADGFRAPVLRAQRFDLIVANILAEPLKRLARDIAVHLAPRGTVILSGLLDEQAPAVVSAYRRVGLRLVARKDIDGWSTLTLRR